jgi:hypothetical protein
MDKYDTKVLIHLLVVVFKFLNLDNANTPLLVQPLEHRRWIFVGVPTSNKEVNKILLKYELSLFQQIVVLEEDMKSHVSWCKKHEFQYFPLMLGF